MLSSSIWTTWELTDILEWWWILKIEPVLHRGVALLCACLSICILWSELVFNVKNPVLSIVALGLEACGFNYAAVEVRSITRTILQRELLDIYHTYY